VAVAAAAIAAVPLSASAAPGQARQAQPALPPIVQRWIPVPVSALVPRADRASVRTGADGRTTTTTSRIAARPFSFCAPVWFNTIGVTWQQRGSAAASFALSTAGATPALARAPSIRLGPSDSGPDPGSIEDHPGLMATDPAWVGTQRCARLTATLPAGVTVWDMRTLVINTLGNTRGGAPDSIVLTPETPLANPDLGMAPSQPSIITRDQWKPDLGDLRCFGGYSDLVKMAFVHHTVNSNTYTKGEAYGLVRGIFAFQTNGNKWCDIGYNFLVDRYGEIFEGRAGGMERAVLPAAQKGFNTNSTAVAAIGNFETGSPTSSLLSSIEKLVAWRLNINHADPTTKSRMQSAGGQGNKYPKGTWVYLKRVSGHRDVNYTACPGDNLYADLGTIRSVAHDTGLPKIYLPDQSTDSFDAGTGSVSWTATASKSVSWSVTVSNSVGDAIRSWTSSGSTLSLSWDGTDTGGTAEPPGTYAVLLKATSGSSVGSRSWLLTLTGTPAAPGSIAFDSDRSGDTGLYAMGGDGTGQAAVAGGEPGTTPVWSPTGTQVAFTSTRSGTSQLWVMNTDGSNPNLYTHKGSFNGSPAWSPDGGQIAFTTNRTGKDQVYTINADGTDAESLTTKGGWDPVWSPDGEQVAFTSDRSGKAEVYTTWVNGWGTKLQTHVGSNWGPAWSPDGSQLVFTSSRSGANRLWLLDLSGGITQLTNATTSDSQPAWSPDGTQIAFMGDSGTDKQIYVIGPDGSGLTQLTTAGTANQDPAWESVNR
jgi:hypothetical protein